MLSRGRYLFFNREYKRQFIDFYLGADEQRRLEIPFWCIEYRANQRLHLQKILKLDYDLDERFSEWFLSQYDRVVATLDINDCYESLAANLKQWIPLLIDRKAVRIQQDIDRTFTVKTEFDSEWVDDLERDCCSLAECNVKFGVIQRKHHCRSCGDIFCKNHTEKMSLRRNEALELEPARSITQSPHYQGITVDETAYNKVGQRILSQAVLTQCQTSGEILLRFEQVEVSQNIYFTVSSIMQHHEAKLAL